MFFCCDFLKFSILEQFKFSYKVFFFFSNFLKIILSNFLFVIRFHFYSLELITTVNRLLLILLFLNKTIFIQLVLLLDIAVRDFIQKILRFSITYIALSVKFNVKFYITSFVNELDSIASVIKIYNNANWFEREIWDMFGLFFLNHPDLRRILTDYGFFYFPLRKDFPLTGFVEISYSDIQKKLLYTPISLLQEYRTFSLHTPWIE
jgi:NADH:ubiquinone oxidoreductase subunit C